MRLSNHKKIEYPRNKSLSIFCVVMYIICLLYIRFTNHLENIITNPQIFAITTTVAVIIITFVNCVMCVGGWPSKSLYLNINDFDLSSNCRNGFKAQRDTLLDSLRPKEFSRKFAAILVCCEIIACLFVCVFFYIDKTNANLLTGIVIDIETAIMTAIYFYDLHYKFTIKNNLKL